jgi:secreted trypsin-like serine protease
VGALVLAAPVTDITPANLPYEGFLNELKADGELRQKSVGARFTVVGYGGTLTWHQQPPEIAYDDQRRYAESEYKAITPVWLHMCQNMIHEDGDTCHGDSGGPAFWTQPDGEVLVGITSTGDAQCVATGLNYRVDLPSTLDFIEDVIATLPEPPGGSP